MSAARRSAPEQRVKDLAAIHVSAKQLGMTRDVYESVLQRVAGVRSAADLDAGGRRKVLAELGRLGADRRPVRTRRGTARPGQYPDRPANIEREPMLRKIEALLTELAAPWSYADAIARQMFRVEKVAWLRRSDQLRAVIAALDARRLKKQSLESHTCPRSSRPAAQEEP